MIAQYDLLCYLEEVDSVAVQDRPTDVARVTELADCYADMLLATLSGVPPCLMQKMLAGTMLSFLAEALETVGVTDE